MDPACISYFMCKGSTNSRLAASSSCHFVRIDSDDVSPGWVDSPLCEPRIACYESKCGRGLALPESGREFWRYRSFLITSKVFADNTSVTLGNWNYLTADSGYFFS
jgi:hypothetical protein